MLIKGESIAIRLAVLGDRDVLMTMQALSMRVLGASVYTHAEIEGFIAQIGTMDDFLLHEGTYYVATLGGVIVASGGWSRLRPNYVNARRAAGHAGFDSDQPKIRSVYVHPDFARRGIATLLMDRAEREIFSTGFRTVELTATLSGVPFYLRRSYMETGVISVPLADGNTIRGMTMSKALPAETGSPPLKKAG